MEIKELGDVLELQRGYDLPHSEMNEGVVPVAGSNGIIGYHDVAKLQPPCITIGRSGSVGKLHRYDVPVWPHNTSLFISDFKGNDDKYLFYLLKTIDFNKVCDSSVIPSLNRNFVYPIKIYFETDVKKQKKIASVLSALDDKIALNKKMNQKLEAMAKRLYDYWFVQYDFPDKNGHPYKTTGGKMEYNETLKREIPEGWNDGALSDIANITMGQSPDGASYNEDGEGMIFYQGSTDFGMRFPTVRQYTTAPTRFAKKGDILMSVRAPVGAVNIANTDCCIGRGLSALNSKLGSLSHLYFLIDVFKKTFENKNTVGTTFGSITKDELYALPVVIPDKKVIEQFEKMAKPIFDRQMKLGEESNRLIKLRDKLLPLLMNGQVEVK
ncbi:restriction endonuclease subunit S [Candidatus Saccharibacteria bacterium]|nr:restriction endonuclease subunit S [Candidatus Saccharibacteria bacterium]